MSCCQQCGRTPRLQDPLVERSVPGSQGWRQSVCGGCIAVIELLAAWAQTAIGSEVDLQIRRAVRGVTRNVGRHGGQAQTIFLQGAVNQLKANLARISGHR